MLSSDLKYLFEINTQQCSSGLIEFDYNFNV